MNSNNMDYNNDKDMDYYHNDMNALLILYIIFRGYHRRLNRIERIFLYTFIIDISGYSVLFLSYLISTNKFGYNFVNILLLFFPLISGIITVIILQFHTVYFKNPEFTNIYIY